jgi:parvulin-like peptidyl-prolyl isomerase
VNVKEGGRAPWDLGIMEWKRIPPEWIDVAYGLKEGESAVVVGARTGVHLVTLVARQENPDLDLKSLRPVVTNRLKDVKLREARDSYLSGLRENARIEKKEGWKLLGE